MIVPHLNKIKNKLKFKISQDMVETHELRHKI